MGALVLPAVALALAALPLDAGAHGGAGDAAHAGEVAWSVVLALLLAASALLYVAGVRRLWRRAGAERGVRRAAVVRFALGWTVLAAALFSPIDALADRSFALHMVQHELLMIVAAPLLVLARPLEAWTWALAPRVRRRIARAVGVFARSRAWHAASSATGAWSLHAIALWSWHVPAPFVAALGHPSLHVLQHTCFLGTALLFWWRAFRPRATAGSGGAMLAVFTTMLHTGALGALLTFATRPWYLAPGQVAVFGLTAIEDQQLGGLVMWVPGSLAYLVAGLVIVASWLARPSRAPGVAHAARA